ncbi:MAG TPA: thioesterase family protein [Mycobacteriales bacterium]|nr:thioesterase family protein [Mycobacteriales bacterium]
MTALREVCRQVEHVDTDAGGVVHFSRYASLLETAVLDNFERLGVGVRRLERDGLELAVAELRMNYFAPARFFDQLRIQLKVDRVGGASCTLSGTVHSGQDCTGAVLAAGELVICVVDREAGTATALPGELRRVLRTCQDGEST